jgi:serine phosphatase RsbU (regulator of sigma subunit)
LKINGKSYITAVSYIKEIGWYTLVLVDATQLLSIWKFAPVLGVLALSLLIVIFISTFLVNWMVLKPLISLMASSKSIAGGDYTVRMESDRADEIGQLTESFNHMAATIDDYTENLENLVAVRTEELRRSNKEITDSIDYAKIIQSSMLPDEGLLKEHFSDHFIIWRPRDIVGGDIYFACKTGNGIIFSVIDCTGHGTSGALMTMTAIAVVQECINRSQTLDDPGLILKDINVMMRQVLHQGSRSNRNDNGMDIGLALYLQEQGKLIYSGARLSLIVASDRGVTEIRGDKMSVGYMDSDVEHSFRNHVIDVSGDCALYMASDGLIDQPGGVKGYSLGRKAFHRHLQNTWHQPMETQRTLLEQMIDDYSYGQDQRDDITVVGFRFR